MSQQRAPAPAPTAASIQPPNNEVLGAPVSQLIELFRAHMAEVQFPGVNAEVLSSLGEKVERAHAAVQALETDLRDAREQRNELQSNLQGKATTALAYAKVYASDHPQLREALGDISLGPKSGEKRAAKRAARRKPKGSIDGKPHKAPRRKTDQETLPLPGATLPGPTLPGPTLPGPTLPEPSNAAAASRA